MSVRSAKSGKFVKSSEASDNPDTTVTEGATKKTKSDCPHCHFMGDSSGLQDESTLCPFCKGSGRV